MLTFGSLFAGIGGLDLGLERAGMTCLWQVEIDEFCRKVLAKHWPDVERFGDVRDCGSHNLRPVDLVCGGFPCQPVSCAGKRQGESDERWLWPEFARVICELKPRWVLAENVPGLLSVDAGRVFGGILRDLAALGYDAEWDCIPACAFGSHHIRDRVFILASRSDTIVVRPQRQWATSTQPWSREQFARLVQADLRVSVPASTSGGVSDGARNRMDRLRALGNAVVPQVAEFVGRMIVKAEKGLRG